MTVSGTTTSLSFTGNGSTTAFAVSFPFQGTLAASELTVVQRTIATGAEVTLDYTTHYTVAGGNGSTGVVTAGTAPADTVQWHIRRNTSTTQTSDYVANDPFSADTIERNLDRQAMTGQERDSDIAAAFKFPDTYTAGASTTMPEPVASAYLQFNAAGTALTTSSTVAGQSLGANGTVSLPFYSFSSDPDSGVYRIGANNIGVSVNGTKALDIATTGLTVTGAIEATGDTSASDNAAFGYDSVNVAILTGQGSSNDVVLKNDADAIALEVPTGSQNVNMLGNLVLTGNLTVNGTTVTNDATNTEIKDPLIELNSGAGSNANDLGLIMERGSTGNNAVILWDESGDFFTVGTTTATAGSTGNMTYAFAPFKCSTLTATAGTLAGITSLAMSAGATLTAGFLDEDNMASDSAVAGVTQQSTKAYVDASSKAAGISMLWETTTSDTDQGAGKVWANNATLSSATVLYFDDVERGGVSINALIDTLDDPTATNSATIYIQEAGTATAGVVFKVSGAVTSASTYSKVAVTHMATFGTLADGDVIGVTIAFSGNNGNDYTADAELNAIAGLTSAAGKMIEFTGSGAAQVITVTTAGKALIDDANASAQRTTLGLAIGSDVQAFDADTAKLDVDQVWAGAQRATVTALSSSSNAIAIDFGSSNDFSHTLTENTTLSAPTGTQVAGQSGSIFITQHASSPKSLAFNAEYLTAGGVDPVITATNNAKDRIDYVIRADGVMEITAVLALA